MTARRRAGAAALLAAWAATLLAIGITRDWRLLHEDNGALHTTFALSHLELGLRGTGGLQVYHEPATGVSHVYGHHPALLSLLVASSFAATGSDAPWAARLVPIAFQLASLALFVALLRIHLRSRLALLGGAIFATLPMGAFFGRMVNYEAPCLFGVLLQLYGYAHLHASGARAGLLVLALGVALAGLVDWPGLFFAAALGAVAAVDAARGERAARRTLAFVAVVATATLAADLWHLAAGGGSLGHFLEAVHGMDSQPPVGFGSFVDAQLGHWRRWFGRAAIVASALLAAALAFPRSPLARPLRAASAPDTLARWLAASGLAALAYVVAAPAWAVVHAYWSFYWLPFVATALTLLASELWARRREGGRRWVWAALLALVAFDVGNTAVRTLVKQHRTPEPYAAERTGFYRERFLMPQSWRERR